MYGAAAFPITLLNTLSSNMIQITCWYVVGADVAQPHAGSVPADDVSDAAG